MKTTGKKNSKTSGSMEYSIEESSLMKLFENELKEMYWSEKALSKAFPKLVKSATSEELIESLENHLEETENQVKKVERVFESIEKKPSVQKCIAIEGLIKEAEDIIRETKEGAMLDAGIITATQKIEHYEIASYGALRNYAQTLGLDEAIILLDEILDEEKGADEKLTHIAESTINLHAPQEIEEEAEEEEE